MLAPVSNLTLTKAVDREVRVDRVTFVATARLPYVRKRLGVASRISSLIKNEGFRRIVAADADTVAILRLTGVGKVLEKDFSALLREELAIFNSSFLGFARDRLKAKPAFADKKPRGTRSRAFLHSDGKSGWLRSEVLTGFGQEVDGFWLRSARENFFFPLLAVLRKDVGVAPSWRSDLRNAAVLLGQSQTASDLPLAFLLNMIALELLVTSQSDKVVDALPQRAEAFLGWTGYWASDGFGERIRDLYRKRCLLVHQGRRDGISLEDVVFSDELLLNLLSNLVRHPKLFGSKDDVVEFSERFKAEQLLGIDTGVRPRTLRAQFRVIGRGQELERAF